MKLSFIALALALLAISNALRVSKETHEPCAFDSNGNIICR